MVRRMATDHARTAVTLIDQAYAEADPALFVNPTDAPFVKGLAFYKAEVAKARRIIRFAAIASACGRSQEANALVSELPEIPTAVVYRHIDVHAEFIRGVKRSVGLTGSDIESIREMTDSLWPKFEQSIEKAFR